MTGPRENPPDAGGGANGNVEVELARLGEQIHALQNTFTDEKVASKEAIAAAFKAAETATAAALQAQKESAAKAEQNQKEQLTMHNGLLKKMDTLVANFPTKESVAKDFETRDGRISTLESSVARAYGAAASAVALGGISIALILAQ